MASRVYQVSNDIFITLIKNSKTYSQCLRELGLKTNGGSSLDVLKRRIAELNCSTEHFCSASSNQYNIRYTLEEILIDNSSYSNLGSLKRRLLNAKLLEYKCAICGLENWQGRKIALHLDHINGKNNDHRIENLRLLCPNCHSQTNTYAGANKIEYKCSNSHKKIYYCTVCGTSVSRGSDICRSCSDKKRQSASCPSREELKDLIRTIPFTELGKRFKVSDNAIRKWCQTKKLPYRKADIKRYTDEEWDLI